MPIYSHEVSRGLRRGVAAMPLFGSAATNTIVLGLLIIMIVVAICILFAVSPPGLGGSRSSMARYAIKCAVYATPAVLLLLYVYAGSIAAVTEGAGAGDVAHFVTAQPRLPGDAPANSGGQFGDPKFSPNFQGGAAGAAPPPAPQDFDNRTSISRQLAEIEKSLPQNVHV